MNMLVCPSCGFFGPPDAYLAEGSESRGILLALSAPAALAQPIQQYLRLFRPPKRAMSSRRVVTLLEELLPMILEAKVSRDGQVYAAPLDYWREAIDEMVQRRNSLTLPLKGHGYLISVIAGYAKKAEAAAEGQSNQRRAGATPTGVSAAHAEFKPETQPTKAHNPAVAKRAMAEAKAILNPRNKETS